MSRQAEKLLEYIDSQIASVEKQLLTGPSSQDLTLEAQSVAYRALVKVRGHLYNIRHSAAEIFRLGDDDDNDNLDPLDDPKKKER